MQASRSKRLLLPLFVAHCAAACAGAPEQAKAPEPHVASPRKTPPKRAPTTRRDDATSHDTPAPPPPEKRPSCEEYASLRSRGRFAGEASYYADSLAGNKTASGKPYDPRAFSAAHRKLRFGTLLRVTDEKTGAATCVIVNDRGPFGKASRVLDLSRAAAEELGIVRRGVARVKVEILRE